MAGLRRGVGQPPEVKKRVEAGRAPQVCEVMQIICPTTLTPLQYLEQDAAEQVQMPEKCANCGGANCLEALGYYRRWISHLLDCLRIRVRRFLCLQCCMSISCLPDFAQPYRVVNTHTVESGFSGGKSLPELHWGWLIEAYWKKFTAYLQSLLRTVGNAFGPCPVQASPEDFWKLILKECASLAAATEQLVRKFRICLFGTYRCHQHKIFAK